MSRSTSRIHVSFSSGLAGLILTNWFNFVLTSLHLIPHSLGNTSIGWDMNLIGLCVAWYGAAHEQVSMTFFLDLELPLYYLVIWSSPSRTPCPSSAVLVALASTNKILRSAYHLDFKTCMAQKGARKLWLRMQRAKYSVFSLFCQNNIRGLDGLLTPSQALRHQYVILASSIITALWTTWWNAEVFSGSSEKLQHQEDKKAEQLEKKASEQKADTSH